MMFWDAKNVDGGAVFGNEELVPFGGEALRFGPVGQEKHSAQDQRRVGDSWLGSRALVLPRCPALLTTQRRGDRRTVRIGDDAGLLLVYCDRVAEYGIGVALIYCVARRTHPGRQISLKVCGMLAGCGLTVLVLVSWVNFRLNPTLVPESKAAPLLVFCVTLVLINSLPLLLLGWSRLARTLATRPFTAGVMVGLGAGLLADAIWRLGSPHRSALSPTRMRSKALRRPPAKRVSPSRLEDRGVGVFFGEET